VCRRRKCTSQSAPNVPLSGAIPLAYCILLHIACFPAPARPWRPSPSSLLPQRHSFSPTALRLHWPPERQPHHIHPSSLCPNQPNSHLKSFPTSQSTPFAVSIARQQDSLLSLSLTNPARVSRSLLSSPIRSPQPLDHHLAHPHSQHQHLVLFHRAQPCAIDSVLGLAPTTDSRASQGRRVRDPLERTQAASTSAEGTRNVGACGGS